jgi:hypothetical protein
MFSCPTKPEIGLIKGMHNQLLSLSPK